MSLPVLSLLHSLASGTISLSSPSNHQIPHPPFSFTSRPHSTSLFRDTPTITSRISDETDKTKHSQESALPKKGTRFKLPGLEMNTMSFGDHQANVASSNRTAMVDTLNVLGVQPSFREPYPESVYTDVSQTINDDDDGSILYEDDYHKERNSDAVHHLIKPQEQHTGSAYTCDVESIATQSLVDSELVPKTIDSSRASTHSQHLSGMGELYSELTLGEISPSHSFIITSSPWLKSSISNNGSNSKLTTDAGDATIHRGTRDTQTPDHRVDVKQQPNKTNNVCGDIIEEEVRSSSEESLDKVGLVDKSHSLHSPNRHVTTEGSRNVTLSLLPRNIETRCTHYTHSSSALSGGAGVPGSRIAPSTIYQHSIYSPLTIDIEEEDDVHGKGMLINGGPVTGKIAELSHCPAFERWPSEVAVAYTLGMCDVVIYGRTSHIQSSALQGLLHSKDKDLEGKLGLKQLTEFTLTDHSSSGYYIVYMYYMNMG